MHSSLRLCCRKQLQSMERKLNVTSQKNFMQAPKYELPEDIDRFNKEQEGFFIRSIGDRLEILSKVGSFKLRKYESDSSILAIAESEYPSVWLVRNEKELNEGNYAAILYLPGIVRRLKWSDKSSGQIIIYDGMLMCVQ